MSINFNNNVKKATPNIKTTNNDNLPVMKHEIPMPTIKEPKEEIQLYSSKQNNNKWNDPSILLPEAFNIVKKVQNISKELKSLIVERESLIDSLLVAIITANHAVMLGVPGTAKSQLANEICNRIIGGRFFSCLLNKTTDPSAVLGPYSIKAMEQDQFMRNTAGFLPEAHIAFLDEIFKCNAPTLNILLTILNERAFHNGGKLYDVPLISMICASNEEPDDETLDALYDRILFRFIVDPVKDAKNRLNMYSSFLDRRIPNANNNIINSLTIDELTSLKMAARYVSVSDSIRSQYDSLLIELETKHQIRVSDRRKNQGLNVLQGSAILNERNTVTSEDFIHLIPVWWQRREDIPIITEIILKATNPNKAKISEHRQNIKDILAKIETLSGPERQALVCEAKSLFSVIMKDTDKMYKASVKVGKDTSDLQEFYKYANEESAKLLKKELMIDDIDGFDDDLDKLINLDD